MKLPKASFLFLLLLCWLTANHTTAQVAEKLTALAHLTRWEEVEKKLAGICTTSENNSCYNEVNWQLVGPFTEVSKRVEKLVPTKEGDGRIIKRQYRLDFLLKEKQVVHCRITDISRDKKPVQLAEKTNETAVRELAELYRKAYGRTLTLSDLFSANSRDEYGEHCGIAGSQPALRQKMEQLLSAKSYSELENWLASPMPVKQVYAVEAFYKLKQHGYPISAEQLQRILLVKNKQGKINSCAGCFINTLPITEATKAFTF